MRRLMTTSFARNHTVHSELATSSLLLLSMCSLADQRERGLKQQCDTTTFGCVLLDQRELGQKQKREQLREPIFYDSHHDEYDENNK